ncbi:MAG: hypothetical protein O7J95_12270 [Planctomycetota bacterium]|nr:hypothetical protein [Planctomycetota bacterium]
MRQTFHLYLVLTLSLALSGCARPRTPAGRRAPPGTARALSYLAREVPRWSRENGCFSCHNNGDAARALYTAHRLGYPVPSEALADTSEWLSRPGGWDENKGDPGFSDKSLARVQFTAALATAVDSGVIEDDGVLERAARELAGIQRDDGSWTIEPAHAIGSPATYGTHLATATARRALARAASPELRSAVAKADAWLRGAPRRNVVEAAAVILGLEGGGAPGVPERREECLDLLRRAQAPDGGWGPYLESPTEPFDTALALLALEEVASRRGAPAIKPAVREPAVREPAVREMVRRGREYLLATQLPEGGWLETTRPPGQESYAQHISTSGWATLALLLTEELADD